MAIYHLDEDLLSNGIDSLDKVEVNNIQYINSNKQVQQVIEKYAILGDGSLRFMWEYLASFYTFSDNYGELFSDNYLVKFSDQ